ncbi:MAG: phage holin family protein [Burkholderiaceae bacterium]|nr:phage holin family protein [Burkholderiaceae bacterium]MDP3133197.1 phage holin family protein [Burkholderiaceae bacterium]
MAMAQRPARGADEASEQAPAPPLAQSVRGLLGSGLELVQVRLSLLGVEVQEEVARLGRLWLLATVCCVLLAVGLVFVAILITVALWDSHRLLALAAFSAVFLTAGAVAWAMLHQGLQQGSGLFKASLAELRADIERLRP